MLQENSNMQEKIMFRSESELEQIVLVWGYKVDDSELLSTAANLSCKSEDLLFSFVSYRSLVVVGLF